MWKDAQDRCSLIGYVKSVTDEEGFTLITRGPIQPRTYGVELQYRF